MLILKIVFPVDDSSKLMKFKEDMTVDAVISEIVQGNRLSAPEHYLLYKPEMKTWLDPGSPLSSFGFKIKDQVYLLRQFQLSKVVIVTGKSCDDCKIQEKLILFDFMSPLKEWQTYLFHKCELSTEPVKDGGLSHTLYFEGAKAGQVKKVEEEVPLAKQGFTPTATFCILPRLGSFVEDDFCQVLSEGRRKGVEQKNVPASSHGRDVVVRGKIFRATPKKKFEGAHAILKQSDFYIYPDPDAPSPIVVLDMNNYLVRVVNRKKCIFELVPREGRGKGEVGKGNGGLEAFRFDESESDKMGRWIKSLNNVAGVRSLSAEEGPVEEDGPPIQYPKNIYGGLIHEACIGDEEIPDLITSTIQWLDKKALTVEGIFRLSGDANKIKAYREQYNAGEKVDLEAEKNPHNVAGILKLYLRELADPILPFDFYSDFLAAETCNIPEGKKGYTRHLIAQLPKVNRVTLEYLIKFLKKVDQHSAENNMAIHNLATVFGPNLIKSKNETMFSMAASTAQTNSVVHTLIDGFDVVFGHKPFVLPSDKPTGVTAEAVFDFDGAKEDPRQLSFEKDDLLCVVHIGADGWWRGGIGSNFGRFPGSYVKELPEGQAVRSFRKRQYTLKMQELAKQVEEEEKKVNELMGEKRALDLRMDELEREKVEVIARSAQIVERILPAFNENEFLKSFVTYYEWTCRLQKNQEDYAKLKGSLLEEMTSLKNALPATSKKKPAKGQPTLETLRLSFDTTKTKLDEEMEMCRRLYSTTPHSSGSSSASSSLPASSCSSGGEAGPVEGEIVLVDGSDRKQVMEAMYSMCERIVGTDAIGQTLSDTIGQLDTFSGVCKSETEKFLEEDRTKKDKGAKTPTKKSRFSLRK